MPTNKQRREAARRKLERQLAARVARERRRKRTIAVLTSVGVVVILALVVVFVALTNNKHKNNAGDSSTSQRSPLPSRSATPIAARDPKKSTGPCGYAESATDLTNPDAYDVGLPPDPKVTPTATRTVTFTTNQGVITAQLVGKDTPCNVQSLVYLITKKFYDNTACTRASDTGIYIIQCGDPSGTGGGSPTYNVKDENLAKASYTAGTIAMSNGGANTNGSQFFFITQDSNTGLQKSYTVVGKVTAGMDILQKVAAAGNDGSLDPNPGGGRPNLDLTFITVTVK